MCGELGQHERRCGNCGIAYRQGARSMGPDCPLCAERRERRALERRVGELEATVEQLVADGVADEQ